MICSLCGRRELKANEFICSVCFPKFKEILMKYAKGIKEVKREGGKVIQLTLEFKK